MTGQPRVTESGGVLSPTARRIAIEIVEQLAEAKVIKPPLNVAVEIIYRRLLRMCVDPELEGALEEALARRAGHGE